MKRKSRDGDTPMQRFEEFARRIFSVSKEDLKKAEEEVEEIVEKIAEPTKRSTPDE
ncbi:MAG TPA: hypothetical protein VMV82_01230 [Candidatus Dormibacteraeota bacterium]|nr:hypothetical protein [Candidatus Dormibacteraeota bacterium]